MARLFVLSGATIGSTFDIDGTSILGRGDDADVVLREKSVSRKHARLVPQPESGVWKVVDLDSSNGLHVGGKRVRTALVRDGETFVLGDVEIRLRDDAAQSPAPEPTAPARSSSASEGGIELEFGDDIDLELTRPAAPAQAKAPASRPRPGAKPRPADRSAERATVDRQSRRAAAIGAGSPSAGVAARPSTSDVGRPALQYGGQGRGGIDLAQLPGWMRTLLVLAAFAVAAGIAYGAFTLTRTARGQSATLSESAE